MTIRYKNEPEDFAAASDWYLTNTKDGKTLARNAVIRGCIFLAVMCGALALAVPSSRPYLLVESLFGCLIFVFAIPARIKAVSRKQSVAMFKKPENAGFLDERTLQITPEDLFSYSSQATTALKWTAIDKIVVTEKSAIFFLGSLQSLVVPRDRIVDGNFSDFVTEASRFHAAAKNQSTPVPIPAR